MTRIILVIVALTGTLFVAGCETANQGANQAGQGVGSAMRVPNSFTEGAAKGVAGQPNPNPYGR